MDDKVRKKVLIVEDSEIDALILGKCLASEYDVVYTTAGELALKMLKKMKIDAVVLDVQLPGISGFEVLRSIRARVRRDYLGIVILTADNDVRTSEKALDMGADCFGAKPDAIHQILPLVRSALRVKQMTDELKEVNRKLKRANNKLKKLSITDQLTGLYNMRYINQQMLYEYRRAKRYGSFFSVIMIDIDHFKMVNDQSDHLMGSYVISQVGAQIDKVTRDVDFAGRYGGDEFIVVLPETTEEGAYQVAARLRDMVNHTLYDNGTNQVRITLSQGVSCFDPEGGTKVSGLQDILRSADFGLYEAKEHGRDRIVIFDPKNLDIHSNKAS